MIPSDIEKPTTSSSTPLPFFIYFFLKKKKTWTALATKTFFGINRKSH